MVETPDGLLNLDIHSSKITDMKNIITLCMIVCLLLGTTDALWAQSGIPETLDIIHLHNGSVYRGKIVEVKEDRSIVLEIHNEQRIEFKAEEIQKIVQESLDSPDKYRRPLSELPQKGWNGDVALGFNAARSGDWLVGGLSLHGRVGYQWNSWLGTSLLFGIEKFDFRRWGGSPEVLLPLMADFQVFPFPNDSRWFAAFGAGYSPAFLLSSNGEARGGWTAFPRVGMRVPSASQTMFIVDFGFRVQQSSYDSGWNGWQSVETNAVYQRFNLRMGFQFW